jgi:hypothetical protein
MHKKKASRKKVRKQVNTASLELCKELYRLSGWGRGMGDRTAWEYTQYEEGSNWRVTPWGYGVCYASHVAYDLGYLLWKLPKSVTEFWGRAYPASPCLMYSGTQWVMFYQSEMTGEHNTDELFGQFADTPEDAACKLAIELFKQDVLKKEKV